MAQSMNGWTASPSLALRPLVVDGVAFVPGIRDDDDVAYVMRYVMTQFHERVEPLVNPGCWGFNFRPNVNNPDTLSNHASGTAVDANAPQHPNGVPTSATFTDRQIDEVHRIIAEVEGSVRWGGDFRGNPDAMHFEIDVSPTELAAVAARLRAQLEDDMPAPKDWDAADWEAFDEHVESASRKGVLNGVVNNKGTKVKAVLEGLWRFINIGGGK